MAAMLSIITLLDSIATPTVAAWLLRITLLSAMACALLLLTRRAQPALRHAVAVGSLVAVALLPAVSSLLPAVSLPVLPARPADATTPAVVATPSPVVTSDPAPVEIEYIPAHYTVGAIDDATITPAAPEEIAVPSLASRVKAFALSAVQSPTNWIRLGIVLWMLVAAALLVRLAVAFRRAAGLSRRSLPVDVDAIEAAVERACRVLGVGRRPYVDLSNEISVPMVAGVVRPRILLPASAAPWTHQRLTVVLLHEVAHIRRRDPAWMLLAQLVGAILWFHPFVRALSISVRHDSELACDDLVLGTGVRASDYAGHLVSIASMSALRDTVTRATLAFAARSTLEHRVMSILAARRAAASRRVTGAMAFASLALFITIAVANPTHGTLAEYENGKQQYEAEKAELQQEYATGKADFEMQRSIQQARRAAQQSQLQQIPIQGAVHAAVQDQAQTQVKESCNEATSCSKATSCNQVTVMTQDMQVKVAHDVQNAMNIQLANHNDNDDEDEEGAEWYGRAHNYYQKERWEQAGRAYENAARFGYNTETAYYNAGCSYALAKQEKEAMDMLEAAFDEGFDDLDMYASDEDLNSLRGTPRFKKLMEKVLNTDEAEQDRRAAGKQFERLSRDKAVEEGEWNEVGVDLMRAGDYDRAATAFDNEFKLSKNTSENALYNKACSRALEGKSADALKLLEQSITTGSVDSEHMAEDPDLLSLHKNKRFDELVKMAEDLELEYAGFEGHNVWNFYGKKLKRISYDDEVKEWKKSVDRFREVANRYPTVGRAWFNLGYAQLKSEQPKDATLSFQKSLDLGYKPPVMMYNLACSTALAGDTDAAFSWLDKSEKAGFEVWNSARWDEDLDPLRADPRYKELKKRWKEEERDHAAEHGVKIQMD